MTKKLIILIACLSLSIGLTYADDFNNVLRGIRSGIETFSDANRLREQIIQTNAQKEQLQQKLQQETPVNPVISQPIEETKQLQESTPKIIEVSFFGGLKPESSVLDVINTFKKYDSVTNIKITFGDKVISANDKPINFKTAYCDKTTLSKYFEETIPDGLYSKRYGYLLSDYKKSVSLSNGKQGKIIALSTPINVYIDKMYIDSIPCSVTARFELSEDFYSLHPDKVLVGATKHIGYPYIIETIKFNTNSYDSSVQGIAQQNRTDIINKFIEKYGTSESSSCYEGQFCNDFIDLGFSPNFSITYNNYIYIKDLANKYKEFKMNETIQRSNGLNSSNDI